MNNDIDLSAPCTIFKMPPSHTINNLIRWSCKPKQLPDISAVKNVHVYDFDNTLFSSPAPNPQLWHPQSIGTLQGYETFAHGGWWHNPDILAATGEGVEKEEPKGWRGWWNETIVSLVELSSQDPQTVTILLTGRGETNFAELVNKILNSRKLDFDMVVLKPQVGPNQQQFNSTMDFKQAFLRDLVLTYRNANNIRIYEDRVKHVKGFRDFMEKLNKAFLSNAPDSMAQERNTTCAAEVVHVCELKSLLEPQAEIMAIQSALNKHNKAIKTGGTNPTRAPERYYRINEHFQYFGYMISQTDSARLITLCNAQAHQIDSGEVKYMASSILIVPFYPRQDILNKVGGRGTKVTWQVTGVAKFEDRIWAARVTPISDKPTYTQDETPMVILAIRKGSRQIDANRIKNWQPPSSDKQFIFETVADDKLQLKIEEIDENTVGNEGIPKDRHRRGGKRKFQDEDGNKSADQSWAQIAKPAQGNKFRGNQKFNKKASHANFNNQSNAGVNANGIPTAPANNNRRQRGNAGRGGRGGFGYKSLDDYNNAFEGGNDTQSDNNATASGAMIMDY